MSKKDGSLKTVSRSSVRKTASETNFKAVKEKKGIKQSLKLLETGELKLGDIEDFADELKLKPELADNIQYELHKYCKEVERVNVDLVVKLAELCYSEECVSQFSNIDRFVGCVYFICSCLLKKEKFSYALLVASVLSIKKNEIIEHSKEKPDIRTFLCNLHSTIMVSAIAAAPKVKSTTDKLYETCHKLVMESLNVFNMTTKEQPDVGKKVLKTTALYLQALKHYKEKDIIQFFDTLRATLKVLLPQMGSLDYFLFFLCKVYVVNKPSTDAEVPQMVRKTVDLLTIFMNSSVAVRNTLNKMVDFFWVETKEEKWISVEEFSVLKGNEYSNDLHFLIVSVIFSFGVEYLWTKSEKNWCENISVAIVKTVSKSIMDFHKSNSENRQFYCSSGQKVPFDVCYGNLFTGNLQKIQYTVRLCLKNKVPNALSLVQLSQEAFRLSLQCLNSMKAFGCCEKQRLFSWKLSVIHHTNTVEDICRIAPSDESWFYMKECSQEIIREIVNTEMELPFDFARLKILFQRWHISCLKFKDYQQALFACVVYYLFYPNEEKDIMSMWIQTKSESSNEILQEVTMEDIFKSHNQKLRDFSKTYNSSNVNMKSALLMELKSYSDCLPDAFKDPNIPYNLVKRIWKKLQKLNLDLWESSMAMSSFILASNAGENGELPNDFQQKCQQLIDNFVNRSVEDKMQCRSLLHAANITFSLFLHNVKMSEKSEGKMEAAQMVLGYLKQAEEEKVKLGEDVDLNLTCDVIPSSRHLTVKLETNYLDELDRIVSLWRDALKCGHEGLPLSSEFDLWLRNVKQVANMYEMLGEFQKALTTWLLYYRIGKLCNNTGASLLGLSHLIQNCSDIDASGLKAEAKLVAEKLSSESSDKYVLVEYYSAMASNYLKNKRSDKCLEHLSSAKKILEGLETTMKTYTLNARFWCLVSKFLVLYKEYETVFDYPVGTDVRVVAFKAFRYANAGGRSDLIKSATQSESTEHVLAMFDVNLWAYNLHGVYRQTDFMRFFLDDLYQIVQKLFLPTRTAEILARLAEVDMICEKGPDCQEKVVKLKSILTTLSPTCGEVVKAEKPKSPYLKVPQKGELDTPAVRRISPVRFINKCPMPKDNDLSPFQFYLKDAKSSRTEEHVKKCKCRLCQNLLIQILTMNTIWLEAEITNLKNSAKEAAGFYKQAYEILNRLELLRAEQSKIVRMELVSVLKEDPGEVDMKLAFVQFYCASFLLRYALFESSNLKSVTENVSNTIMRVSKLMKKFSYEEKLLQWTFTELKLFCVILDKKPVKSPRISGPRPLNTANVEKTPFVIATIGKTPMMNTKTRQAFEKSPRPRVEGRKISLHDGKKSTEDVTKANTSKKVPKERLTHIPSRKLDFDISGDIFEETPSAPQTVKRTARATATKTTKTEARTTTITTTTTTKSEQKTTRTAAAATTTTTTGKSETRPNNPKKQTAVKIYNDSKDDAKKPKKGETKKIARKA